MVACPVILAGGRGTRVSHLLGREPKQFAQLSVTREANSMFSATCARLKLSTAMTVKPMVVVNAAHEELVLKNNDADEFSEVMLEASCNNTACAITMAAIKVSRTYQDGLCVFFPSDHYVGDPRLLMSEIDSVLLQLSAKELEAIVLVLVKAQGVNPHYGHVAIDANCSIGGLCKVTGFIEKPRGLLDCKFGYWNTGIFACKASLYLSVLKSQDNDYYLRCLEAFDRAACDGVFRRIPSVRAPIISVEKLVIERATGLYAKVSKTSWEDLGLAENLLRRLNDPA